MAYFAFLGYFWRWDHIACFGTYPLLALLFSLGCSTALPLLFILLLFFALILETLLFIIRFLLGAMLRLLPGFCLVLDLTEGKDKDRISHNVKSQANGLKP